MPPKVFKSNKKDAVIITRDTCQHKRCEVRKASVGITKLRGCVQYFSPDHQRSIVGRRVLILATCQAKYNDIPAAGEAWLVYPCGTTKDPKEDDYWWEPIFIGFS